MDMNALETFLDATSDTLKAWAILARTHHDHELADQLTRLADEADAVDFDTTPS